MIGKRWLVGRKEEEYDGWLEERRRSMIGKY